MSAAHLPKRPTSARRFRSPPWASRLFSCLAGGVVLAMMVGPQEGTTTDYGHSFHAAVLSPRIGIFLGIGLLLFLAVSFWPLIVPFLTRPGFWPFVSGSLGVLVAQSLMHWYDQVGDSKFSATADAVANTEGISPLAKAFFAWMAWTAFVVVTAGGLLSIVLGLRWVALGIAAVSVAAAIICYLSHQAVVDSSGGVDHSLGYAAEIIGYLVVAAAMLASFLTVGEQAQSREFVTRLLGFRPGLPLVISGLGLGVLSLTISSWFSPTDKNLMFSDTREFLSGAGLTVVATQYLAWLGWALLAVTAAICGAATWLRHRPLAWLGAAVGLIGVALTLITIHDISDLAAHTGFDGATGPWQNLGSGGWMACAALFLVGAGGYIAATVPAVTDTNVPTELASALPDKSTAANVRRMLSSATGQSSGFLAAPGAARSALIAAMTIALFYPPTATGFWQQVLVTEVGVSMLLAVGLNVVVGWAGLLDLGFIAFYALGSYTTAYFTGSLPIKPPSFLIMTPLLAIPFAITVCLLSGLALGAPTLRLRGDYLAIVTLGFGEIIHLAAVNAKGITNGSEGTTNDSGTHTKAIPNPSIHLGPLHIEWGLNQLQYWYLLLAFLILIVVAFRRLEQSRLGRAWAAVREDEVAAQATGINTTRVKLAAFAIGASTSGVAGVFFASQIGTFTPDNFVLNNSILIVAYVVFGGMGSLTGALAGAAMLTWLPEFLKYEVPPADKLMWIGAIVMLMMIFRPAGLVPSRRRAVELRHFGESSSAETAAVAIGEGMG